MNFSEHQKQFADHIRNPSVNPPPDGIEDRRMAVYRDLFFNNVEGFISNTFPVLKSILSEEKWMKMTRDFFISHQCQTPLFSEISEEFLKYLQTEYQPGEDDFPFLLELAHYEWVEMAVSISNADEGELDVNPNGDLASECPVLSNVMYNLSYQFPVHTIGPEYLPHDLPENLTHLVVYRDRFDEVHFLEINAVTQHLIESMKHNPDSTGLELVTEIAKQISPDDIETTIAAGQSLLYDLRHRDIVIGTRC